MCFDILPISRTIRRWVNLPVTWEANMSVEQPLSVRPDPDRPNWRRSAGGAGGRDGRGKCGAGIQRPRPRPAGASKQTPPASSKWSPSRRLKRSLSRRLKRSYLRCPIRRSSGAWRGTRCSSTRHEAQPDLTPDAALEPQGYLPFPPRRQASLQRPPCSKRPAPEDHMLRPGFSENTTGTPARESAPCSARCWPGQGTRWPTPGGRLARSVEAPGARCPCSPGSYARCRPR